MKALIYILVIISTLSGALFHGYILRKNPKKELAKIFETIQLAIILSIGALGYMDWYLATSFWVFRFPIHNIIVALLIGEKWYYFGKTWWSDRLLNKVHPSITGMMYLIAMIVGTSLVLGESQVFFKKKVEKLDK